MPRVTFTENLKRHVHCPPQEVNGSTVKEALEQVFSGNTALRGYVLDDQGRLRKHMLIAVDGEFIADRLKLSDPVNENSEIYVAQALSGG
ncbi:MoaD/ThiS family protein [Kaarinaea lacus]